MNALQKKIYDYFDRNPELKVLFIFQNSVDLFAASDLGTAEWRTGLLTSKAIGLRQNTISIMTGNMRRLSSSATQRVLCRQSHYRHPSL